MVHKRIIYALLYSKGFFHLSRNFRLQQVGDINWLKNNFGFGETCDHVDELIILLVTKNPDKKELENFFKDVNKLKEKIFVPLTLGGGIRNLNQAKNCFKNGADKILINYLAHKDSKVINKIMSDVDLIMTEISIAANVFQQTMKNTGKLNLKPLLELHEKLKQKED